MQEITIPDGHKATILGGTIRIEPIEKEFKKGDILYAPHNKKWNNDYFAIYDNHSKDGSLCYDVMFSENGGFVYNFCCDAEGFRLATPEEQQILFDALAKEGKYWDAKALEVKDFIKVPESIGIWSLPQGASGSYGDGLFIGFNEDKQLLGYCDTAYCVEPRTKCHLDKVQCYLQPCKREDLKSGDTAFVGAHLAFIDNYCKVLQKVYARPTPMNGVLLETYESPEIEFYKLIPINK